MKQLLAVIAVFEAFSLAVLLLNTWFLAMLNGGTLVISIRAFDEMWFEYLLWLVLTPVLVLGFHYTLEYFSADDGI